MSNQVDGYDPFDPNDKNIVRLSTWIATRRSGVAQSTIDAFWYVVGLNDAERLKAWLSDHMQEAPTLRKLYEERENGKA